MKSLPWVHGGQHSNIPILPCLVVWSRPFVNGHSHELVWLIRVGYKDQDGERSCLEIFLRPHGPSLEAGGSMLPHPVLDPVSDANSHHLGHVASNTSHLAV